MGALASGADRRSRHRRIAGVSAMDPEAQSLEEAFRIAIHGWRSSGRSADLLAFLHDEALVIESDTPFVLDKTAYANHLGFHRGGDGTPGLWEAIDWVAKDVKYALLGRTGIVSGGFSIRGKPRSAGFRLRHGNFSMLCVWDGQQWRALAVTLSPMQSHVLEASPA